MKILIAFLALASAVLAEPQVLYNTMTADLPASHSIWQGAYVVDGQPGTVTHPWVLLTVVDAERPTLTIGQSASHEWVVDEEAGTFTKVWTITDPTPEELEALTATFTPIETIMARLTDTEFDALTDPEAATAVRRFVKLAEYRGGVRSNSPDLPGAITALDSLGIISSGRWSAILAP